MNSEMETSIASASGNNTVDINRITQVLTNEILKDSIDRLATEGVINLITPNWKKVLYNNPIYQKHKDSKVEYYQPPTTPNKAHYKRHIIQDRDDKFQILVVGLFKVAVMKDPQEKEKHVIQMSSCAPVYEIAETMCKDAEIFNNIKFYMISCGGICPGCKKFGDLFKGNEWCGVETKVFTPDGLKLATREYCSNLFKEESLVIARIEISNKFYFGTNNAKIGGVVKSIIFIKENLLLKDEKITGVLNMSTNFVPTDVYAIPNGLDIPEEEEDYEVSAKKIKI